MAILDILVVDDEPFIRSGINRILRNFQVDYPFMDEPFRFNIIDAATGEEAIERIEEKKPDIILLDNKLPGIQGIEVLEYVRKRQYDIVVIMITSYASLDLAVKATRDGAHDFIPKPFTPQELKSAIESITKHVFLVRMTKQLADDGRQIRFQFLSVLSHELKAPINAIEGYLKMAMERQLGDKLEDYDAVFDRSIQRIKGMRNLILDLLDMTKLESGKKEKEIKELNITKIAKDAIDTIMPYAIQRDVKIKLIAKDEVNYPADPGEIEIIFNNLISNAVKYNRDGGKVDCTITLDDQELCIKVADTGIGMNEEEMARLFKDFVRIKNAKTRNITGSGLGLSILKKLTETYNGDVKLESTPDIGSTFTVTLPVKSN